MRTGMFVVLALLLSGCETARLDTGLKALMGQNIRYAITALGYPDRTGDIPGVPGVHAYVWSTSRQAVMAMPMTTTTTGNVGGVPYYGSTTSMNFVPVSGNCTVQLFTDDSGTITSYRWNGNQIGCKQYARSFPQH